MYATRLRPAVLGRSIAHDAAPYYADPCVYSTSPRQDRRDAEGRALVWFPDSMAGAPLLAEPCGRCGKPIQEHGGYGMEEAGATRDYSHLAPPADWNGVAVRPWRG